MVTKLAQRDHTTAVIAALTAAGITTGRGIRNEQPDGSTAALSPPCAVVHPIPGGRRYGTLDDWTVHADLVYQVTCVGLTASQAEWVRDQSEVLLDGVTVSGRLIDVVRVDFGSDGVARDDDIGAPNLYFTCMPRYRLYSTPA